MRDKNSGVGLKPVGTTFLYTFPFLVYVDTSTELEIKEIEVENKIVRIYPFFRSGKANFLPMPPLKPDNVPFLSRANISLSSSSDLPIVSFIPRLEKDKDGNSQILVSLNDGFFEEYLLYMPMDSLRIDVIDRDENLSQRISDKVIFQLLQVIRCKTKQWWIEHHTTASYLRNIFQILGNGYPLSKPTAFGKQRTVAGDELPINEIIWESVVKELEQGVNTRPYQLRILDARYFAATNDYSRAVLDSVIACEQARDFHFERIWNLSAKGIPFKISRVLSGVNLPNHLSDDLLKMTNGKCSFKLHSPTDFTNIEDLWDARGNIAHGRKNQYRRNGVFDIDENNINELIKSAEVCIDWLESL